MRHAKPLTLFLRRKTALSELLRANPGRVSLLRLQKTGDALVLAASLKAKPGTYTVEVSATGENSVEASAIVQIQLAGIPTVPAGSSPPPVILLNGWQGPSCVASSGPSQTFGSLADQLQNVSNVPAVYFFDNCVENPGAAIEDLGQDLGQILNQIVYDDGTPVPQVDVVAHSMGGLIVRGYLAGLHSDGSITPPVNPGIRKLIEIATPNFGSFFAATLHAPVTDLQTAEMLPGSRFIWNLATWNQRGDDLRDVDALSIVGNGGSWLTLQNASDGVVAMSSASLEFATDPVRTRVLPYCHTDPSALTDFQPLAMLCTGSSIANVDEATNTGRLILSFLADTADWKSIGNTPSQDQMLSQWGGLVFSLTDPNGVFVNDLLSVNWGPVGLHPGGASTSVYYSEYVAGSAAFQALSKSYGSIQCTTAGVQVGSYEAIRCKGGLNINSVAPKLKSPLGIVVQTGVVTIAGTGFGTQCNTCTVTLDPGAYPLTPSSWTDTAITVALPDSTSGYAHLTVQTPSGKDVIDFMAAPAQ
jgi:hypothetical protein